MIMMAICQNVNLKMHYSTYMVYSLTCNQLRYINSCILQYKYITTFVLFCFCFFVSTRHYWILHDPGYSCFNKNITDIQILTKTWQWRMPTQVKNMTYVTNMITGDAIETWKCHMLSTTWLSTCYRLNHWWIVTWHWALAYATFWDKQVFSNFILILFSYVCQLKCQLNCPLLLHFC